MKKLIALLCIACATPKQPKQPEVMVWIDQNLRIWRCDKFGCEIGGYMFIQTCSGKPC